jgi:hypothetical protein
MASITLPKLPLDCPPRIPFQPHSQTEKDGYQMPSALFLFYKNDVKALKITYSFSREINTLENIRVDFNGKTFCIMQVLWYRPTILALRR